MELRTLEDKQDLRQPESAFHTYMKGISTWTKQLESLKVETSPEIVQYDSHKQAALAEFSEFIRKFGRSASTTRTRLLVSQHGPLPK
jgi:outer membrane protein assembly factor BamD (BamD/ComL family)